MLAGLASLALVAGMGVAGSAAAFAVDAPNGTDRVPFGDPQLVACVNAKLGGGRAPDSAVTHDELNTIYGLSCSSDFAVTSLDGIEYAEKMTSLFFAGGKHDFSASGSLAAVSKMPKINSITLNDSNVSNAGLTGLADTATISTMSLTGNPELTDISPLGTLPKLSKLDISKNVKLSDLSPLADSKTLKDFTASQNPELADLSPLAGITTLTSVSVYKTAVSTLEPLAGLTALTNISAGYSDVTSLEPLAGLTKMKFISMDYAKLTSLDGIENMPELRTLDFNSNVEVGDNIDAIRNKPDLYRVHMNGIGATSVEPLSGLTGLTSLQAQGNSLASLVGLPEAPEAAAQGAFSVASQRILLDTAYVPKGSKSFRYDLADDVQRRDGSFPVLGGNLEPTPDPELPIVQIKVMSGWKTLEYTFEDSTKSNDRYSGTVERPMVWTSITSPDSATIPFGQTWEQEVTYTAGFPAASVVVSDTAPSWLTVVDGKLTGTPDAVGDSEFEVRVADALGNTMTQRFNITVPAPGVTVVEIGDDQIAEAGNDLDFTISRTDAVENPYTGEASVRVQSVDGTAVAGTHYTAVDETISWAAGETADKHITVNTMDDVSLSGEFGFELVLSDPTPAGLTELGGGFSSDGTITYPEPGPTKFSISAPQIVEAGSRDLTFRVTRKNDETRPYTGEASVRVGSRDGTAKAGEHYEAVDQVLTFAAGGPDVQTITVKTEPGKAGDPSRMFALYLAGQGQDTDRVTIPPRSGLSGVRMTYPTPEPTIFSLGEGQKATAGTAMTFTVTRENADVNPWTGEASVRVTSQDGTAIAGTHYVAVDEVLTWEADDDAPKTVTVQTTQQTGLDGDFEFTLNLSDPDQYSLVGEEVAAGTVTYVDDSGNADSDNDGSSDAGTNGNADSNGNSGSGSNGNSSAGAQGASANGTATGVHTQGTANSNGGLANTGAGSLWAVALGGVLLAMLGGSALIAVRKRKLS